VKCGECMGTGEDVTPSNVCEDCGGSGMAATAVHISSTNYHPPACGQPRRQRPRDSRAASIDKRGRLRRQGLPPTGV